MRRLGLLLGVLLIAGCVDQAELPYKECLDYEARGQLKNAEYTCREAVKRDPTSKAGKEAQAKQAQLLAKMKEADAQAAEAKKAADAKQAADDVGCTRWSTICTLGTHYDGSERTSGIQYFESRAACEAIAPGMGLTCDPCRCVKSD